MKTLFRIIVEVGPVGMPGLSGMKIWRLISMLYPMVFWTRLFSITPATNGWVPSESPRYSPVPAPKDLIIPNDPAPSGRFRRYVAVRTRDHRRWL